VFAHGHLRLYLLSLLADADAGMHGYELIQALSERFGGTYAPSAGTIYPRLAKLGEEGLVTKSSEGRKTVYVITDAGRAELAAREGELGGIEDDVTDSVRRLADEVRSSVNDAMRSLRADLAAAAREARGKGRSAGGQVRTVRTASTDGTDGTVHTDGTDTMDARGQTRLAVQDAEAALNEFRSELRTALRVHAAVSDLDAEWVKALREGLDALRSSLIARLR
jgi:DNA-binding PadR family transcriptional regulator